jgi:hypothetical protein
MNGLDDIGLTLRHADEIRAFEERHLALPALAGQRHQQQLTTASNRAMCRSSNMKIAILPGDGIGPEIMAQAVKVLNVLGENSPP